MRYETEEEIFEVISAFESATLPHDKCRHAEHLIMAMHYALHNDFDEALNKMRSGILKLNAAHGVVTTNERGYHETLTVVWTRAVFDFVKASSNIGLVELANAIIKKFDKDYPLKFYTRERLFSVEARYNFIEADIKF
jgi:hypothetical protein